MRIWRYGPLTPLEFTFAVFGISIGAGLIGSLLGLGGGIIIVPALSLLMGLDIRQAIGASILAVVATSSGAAATYVRGRIANIRVGMVLEVATVTGALCGAFLVGVVDRQYLFILFSLVMAGTTLAMLVRRADVAVDDADTSRGQDRLGLDGQYHDAALGRNVHYHVTRVRLGMVISSAAGLISGLLGVGGGVVQVPTMSLAMGMPIKTAAATSNFMMGVTAATSAGLYLAYGMINPFVAAPVVAGVFVGARLGSFLLPRVHGRWIRLLFVAVLVYTTARMFLQGVRM